MAYRVRAFTPSDREFIISLTTRLSECDLPPWRPRTQINKTNLASLRQAMEHSQPGSAIFIAEDDSGVAVGFIHLQTQIDYFSGDRHGYVAELAVEGLREGGGIGRLLLQRAEEWARGNGYRLLSLYVFADNGRAQRLYEQNGYRQEAIKYVKVLGKE